MTKDLDKGYLQELRKEALIEKALDCLAIDSFDKAKEVFDLLETEGVQLTKEEKQDLFCSAISKRFTGSLIVPQTATEVSSNLAGALNNAETILEMARQDNLDLGAMTGGVKQTVRVVFGAIVSKTTLAIDVDKELFLGVAQSLADWSFNQGLGIDYKNTAESFKSVLRLGDSQQASGCWMGPETRKLVERFIEHLETIGSK